MKYYIVLGLCITYVMHGKKISLDTIPKDKLYLHYYISKHEGRSYIAFMKDEQGTMYVLKQYLKTNKDDFCVTGQFRAVRELFGARLAQCVGIKANEVCIIPPNMDFIGKKKKKSIATLHTFVPGVPLNKSKFKSVYIKQWTPGKGVPDSNLGLSMKVIQGMTAHEILAMVVAFDQIAGNNDRSRNNLFYESRTDQFYLIDMDRALVYNIADLAYKQLESLFEKKHTLTSKEVRALKKYKQALCTITQKCSYQEICALYDQVCQECGFVKDGFFAHGVLIAKETKKILKESYKSVLKIIKLLQVMEDEKYL